MYISMAQEGFPYDYFGAQVSTRWLHAHFRNEGMPVNRYQIRSRSTSLRVLRVQKIEKLRSRNPNAQSTASEPKLQTPNPQP